MKKPGRHQRASEREENAAQIERDRPAPAPPEPESEPEPVTEPERFPAAPDIEPGEIEEPAPQVCPSGPVCSALLP